jgi:predicted RNA binding protein YcfA (HicA-like mRNA interferase family)
MAKAARVLAALKRDGWTETRRPGSHRVLVKDGQQRIWAYHDGADPGGPAMARIARDRRSRPFSQRFRSAHQAYHWIIVVAL